MGFENRDYVRDSDPRQGSAIGRFSSSSVVTKLIVFTVGVFILQNVFQKPFENWLVMYGPSVFENGQVWRTLTYAFLHSRDSLMHLLFNMVGLYFFGREIEQRYGSREFLMFYLCAAVFAAIVQMAVGFATSSWYSMVGASGSVMGVLAIYAILFPMRKIYIWGIIPVQMRFLVPVIIISDLVMNQNGGNIAGSAHIGGLLFGFIYYYQGIRLERILGGGLIGSFKERSKVRKAKRSNLKVYAPDDRTKSNVSSSSASTAALDEQVDHILAKINEHGEASLTDSEREVLNQASRIARERKS